MLKFVRQMAAMTVVSLLVACGGGGSSSTGGGGGGATPALSADQTVFESIALAPNASYSTVWSLPAVGTCTSCYIGSTYSSIPASPLTGGAQTWSKTPYAALSKTASPPTTTGVARYVINGKILAGTSPESAQISYQGSDIKFELLAADGISVVSSQLRSGYVSVPLTGLIRNSPQELINSSFIFLNTSTVASTATWIAGSVYVKYTSIRSGDLYQVVDNTTATYSTTPTPIANGTTINALMAAGGIESISDSITYTFANGSLSIVNGVTTYVAYSKRPSSATVFVGTDTYRTYYEINGNVYTGQLIKDGAVTNTPIFSLPINGVNAQLLPSKYQIVFNKAAHDSIKAGLTF
jgi:hypothetical protein